MSDYQDEDLDVSTLFLGMTRTPMPFGVPFTACIIEFVVVYCIFIATGNPFLLLLGLVTHGLLYAVSSHDAGIFEDLWLWLKTQGKCRNRTFWTVASFSPQAQRGMTGWR